MLIRPARDDDFPAIAALTSAYIASTSIHFGYQPVSAAELRDAWVKSRDLYPFLVAEDPAAHPSSPPRFAGYAKAGRWRERDAYAWTAELGVYVAPDRHRRGVGRALYLALIDACRQRGFHTLVGGITLPNEPSIRLHEACGFTHAGTFRQVGWKFDAWHDVAFYQLVLAGAQHRPPA